MDDQSRGAYEKFYVERIDGSKKHEQCEFYVLDLMHDKFALPALKAYSEACVDEYPLLWLDLQDKITNMEQRFGEDNNGQG